MNHSLSADKALIFRIVHVKNVPWILENGLHCRNSDRLDPNYVNIGNEDLIRGRTTRIVPVDPSGALSDYVPFYFTPYSIMLLNIITGTHVAKREKNDIAILVSSLHRLREMNVPFAFTDSHAYLVNTRFFNDMSDLGEVNWTLLQSRNFQHDPDDPRRKEQYQAEALAYRHVPVDALLGIVCYTEGVGEKLRHECTLRNLQIDVVTRPKWYF